jgi:signal transduction histidine kinase
MLTVARSVLADLDVAVVLERVLESAREVTGARYAALGVLDETRAELSQFLTLGIDEQTRERIGPLPTGRGVLGELIQNPAPLRIADAARHPHSYGFPVGHPQMTSFLGVPIGVAGEPFGNLYLADKRDGAQFSQEDEEAILLLAEFAGVAIDHARRFSGSEMRRTELERTVSALDATIQIARALGGQTDLATILELVAKRGRALVSARALMIELCQGEELTVAAGAGELPGDLIGQRVDLKGSVASAALRSRQSQRLTDQLNRSRFAQHGLGHLGLDASNGLVVPLIFRDHAYGVLVAIDQLDEDGFTPEHERLLEAFAASAAIAVATAQSAAEERDRQRLEAAEAERSRWARELHDETLQALGNLRLVLATAQRTGKPEAIAAANLQAISQLESGIADLRALITNLRPAVLDQLGTEAAIRALADRLTRDGLNVEVSIDLAYEQGRETERHSPELETAIYRIVQEALTNATKHGRSGRATVDLIEDHHNVRITVRDDGEGFDQTTKAAGFGLLGMRERAELLHGTVSIDSHRGRGATVTAVIPARRRRPEFGTASHAVG